MFSNIASGATPIGSAGRAPNKIFTCRMRVKQKKEDLDSIVTPIRREFILIKCRGNLETVAMGRLNGGARCW
jgi:hypothetical protein